MHFYLPFSPISPRLILLNLVTVVFGEGCKLWSSPFDRSHSGPSHYLTSSEQQHHRMQPIWLNYIKTFTSVILNGCAARFARSVAELSRRCNIEKIIKIVLFNTNFEKGTREKCSRALTNLFSRGFIGFQSKSSVISEKLEFVVSYTKVQFVVELRTNTHVFPVQVRVVSRVSCSLCSLVPKSPARTSRWLKGVTSY
jgi:hypothetical protein